MLCCAVGTYGFCRFAKLKDVVLATVIVTFAFLILGVATEIVFGKFRPHTGISLCRHFASKHSGRQPGHGLHRFILNDSYSAKRKDAVLWNLWRVSDVPGFNQMQKCNSDGASFAGGYLVRVSASATHFCGADFRILAGFNDRVYRRGDRFQSDHGVQ